MNRPGTRSTTPGTSPKVSLLSFDGRPSGPLRGLGFVWRQALVSCPWVERRWGGLHRRCSPAALAAPCTRIDCRVAAGAGSDDGVMTITAMDIAGTAGARTVERFLDAVGAGADMPVELFSPDVVLDATVPGWRFTVRGPDAVARQYSSWFADPATFEELEQLRVEGGEVVTYLLSWIERGLPHAAHHCHLLRFDAIGRIARDRFFCGGRWDAGLLAEMAAANDAG